MTPKSQEIPLEVWLIMAIWGVGIAAWLRWRWNHREEYKDRSDGPSYIPLGFMPIMYAWYRIEPMLLWIAYLRNGKRIARFLKLADDLWMRKKPVDGFLPRWPRR